MSKSAIYVTNTASQNITTNGIINLGSVIRRFGPNLHLSGNAIQIDGSGYYKITASITAAPTAAGNVTVAILKDNVAIPGATGTESVTTANNSANIAITAIVREGCQCCDGASNLTFVLTGTTSAVSNVAVTVEKL